MKRTFASLIGGMVFVVSAATSTVASAGQPQEIIDRPRTLPGGMVEGRLDFGVFGYDQGTSTGLGQRLRLSGGYGLSDAFELRGGYLAQINPGGAGVLTFGMGYSFVALGPASLAGKLSTGYDIEHGALEPLVLGLDAQIKVTGRWAIFLPSHQFEIGLAGQNKPISLHVPVGLRWQANPNVSLDFTTKLARVGLKDSGSVAFGADILPLGVAAYYSLSSRLDFGAQLTDDLYDAADTLTFDLMARLFL